MSGRLVVVSSTTTMAQGSYSDACYFIVIEFPALCDACICQGEATLPPGRKLDFAEDNASKEEVNNHSFENGVVQDGKNKVGVVVITVDTVSGQLLYTGVPQKDVFASMSEAMHAITMLGSYTSSPCEVRTMCEFVAFAGGCLAEETINLLFIEASTLLMGGSAVTTNSNDTTREFNPLFSVPLSNCIPPLFSVDKARWFHIPLRISVPALQQPLTSDGIHDWTLGSRSSTPCGVSTSLLSDDMIPPYLYFSPGVDVTHCCVFGDAVRRLVAFHKAGIERSSLRKFSINPNDNPVSAALRINEFLPPLPRQMGRDALGHCDCLWNEELIRFCDVFGLGEWCCRLALGSCAAVPLPHSGAIARGAILVVRLSRLAFPECFYDYTLSSSKVPLDFYVSTLEAEFQLIVIREPLMSQHDGKEMESTFSFTWRRGTDFACHKNILEQKERFRACAENFIDPLPPREDHVVGLFSAYLERYGPGTRIYLAHAGNVMMQGPTSAEDPDIDVNDFRRCSSSTPGVKSPMKKRRISLVASPRRQGKSLVSQLEISVLGHRGGVDAGAAASTLVNTSLESILQSLTGHVKAHGLRPTVAVGTLWPFSSSVASSPAGMLSEYEDKFLQTFWGREFIHVTQEKTADIGVPRVCVSDESHVSVIASIIVSLGWMLSWLCSELGAGRDAVQFLLESKDWVEDIIRLVGNSAASTPQFRVVFVNREAVDRVRRCLINICGGASVAFSPVVWATAQYIEQLSHYVTDHLSVPKGKEEYRDQQGNGVINKTMHAFLRKFFLSEGGFYPRELVRHRIVLLSHPSRLSSIINVQMIVLPSKVQDSAVTLDRAEVACTGLRERLFPFTPMRHLNAATTCDEAISLVSPSDEGPTPTLSMLHGLIHPFSQPLCMPSCFEVVEFTIALPSLSYVTHVALMVANAVQLAPYAAVLSLSLSASCYVGQAHERVVLEDALLPLCVNSRSSRGRQTAPYLILFELCRPSHDKAPFSTVEEADAGIGAPGHSFNQATPVVARYLHLSLRGSGCHRMALPPILVFGEPVDFIPCKELESVVGRHTVLHRMLYAARSPFTQGVADNLPAAFSGPTTPQSVATAAANDTLSDGGAKKTNGCFGGDQKEKREATGKAHTHGQQEVSTCGATHGQEEMYLQKVNGVIPADLFELNFDVTVAMESKRIQCHARRCYRDLRLHRLGVPLWVMNPAYQVFPHSAFHRSQIPEGAREVEFIRRQQRGHKTASGESCAGGFDSTEETKKGCVKHKDGKRCVLCSRRFSWFSSAKECHRCRRHVCEKCLSAIPVRLLELGFRDRSASVCMACFEKVMRLEDIMRGFTSSECLGEEESDVEMDEAIDFYARCTTPHLASVLALYPIPTYGSYLYSGFLQAFDKQSYQLTMYPLTRVVSAPGMDDVNTPLFEEVLGIMGFNGNVSVGWRCVTDGERTESDTRVSRHVILLLPHGAVVSHGVLRYALLGKLRGNIDVQLLLGNSLHSLEPLSGACIGNSAVPAEGTGDNSLKEVLLQREVFAPSRDVRAKVELPTSTPPKNMTSTSTVMGTLSPRSPTVRLAALYFIGFVSDLFLLRVDHFSLWGRFTSDVPQVNASYYKCRPDHSRYGKFLSNMMHGTSGVLGIASLPRMLPMTRLVPLRNVFLHNNYEQVLMEFDFGVSVTICGFTLELHHPAVMTGMHEGIATALRLIGVTASGYRGNMGIFKLPWPPLISCSSAAPLLSDGSFLDIFSYAYSLPSTAYDVVSVLVEVVEWRLAAHSVGKEHMRRSRTRQGGCSTTNSGREMETTLEPGISFRRKIYLGRMQFWTSANARTQRMVSSHTYTSIHTALDDTQY
ncbi:hypothetical protein TraAM80_00142 [Trypanosoma rangeli]|uniref:FYVE-type domain-containing protein n=1 Tax=Trypanosoma rangeli TaxID=5698 RepID=A0A3R7MCF4_TRYRA|nr:uncharacterized protein TraAM80_00142 [Trypanosoma rangeli]RNF12786.1 hypothetical protein TraAM80_00142 [Trypanosoma rangeli]|eukprot:RNF12786.1 hypothetical protein TraAM80_00142 [Trypanosoma rangeli]